MNFWQSHTTLSVRKFVPWHWFESFLESMALEENFEEKVKNGYL